MLEQLCEFTMSVNFEQLVCIRFCMKLDKFATKIPENPSSESLVQTKILLSSTRVSRPVECRLKTMGVESDQSLAKQETM